MFVFDSVSNDALNQKIWRVLSNGSLLDRILTFLLLGKSVYTGTVC